MAGARARAGQLSAWPLRLPGRRARVGRSAGSIPAQSHFRSCCVAGARRVHDGARACAGRLAQVQFVVVFSSISLKKNCPPHLNCAITLPPLCSPPKHAIMPVMLPPPHYAKIYASLRRSAQYTILFLSRSADTCSRYSQLHVYIAVTEFV